MSIGTKANKSLSLDKDVLDEVERTKGRVSTSERVNTLLKVALEIERARNLQTEAEAFFRSVPEEDRPSRKAFQTASVKSLARED